MRATQFVRRGLIAFAAVATLSLGFSGVAGAQAGGVPGTSPGAVIDGDDAIVFGVVPGFSYDVVSAEGIRSSILAVSTGAGDFPVAVRFLPDFDGAAIINLITDDVIAERPE